MPLGLFENDVFNVFATCVPAVKLNFFRMELLNLLINCYIQYPKFTKSTISPHS